MIDPIIRPGKIFGWLLAFCFCAVLQVDAQFQRPAGGGNFGGGGGNFGGGGGRVGAGGTGTRQYYGNGQVGEATITSDPDSRRIIVITDEETGQYVSQVVTNLDRPKPQVLIKVVFLEVTLNDSLDIGLEGGWRKNIGNSTTSAVANAFGLAGLNSAASSTQLFNAFGQNITGFAPAGAGLYQLMSSDYQVTLRAIAQAGKTEVLSRPSILARNNQPATITVGQRVPLITGVSYPTLGATVNNFSYTDVGIILRVTPFIHPDGMVEMIVSPEISSLTDQSVPVAAGVSAPVIANRSADTVVVTPDGQTVIIGGLMQNTKTASDSKIPFLGDIPVIGNLFKRKVRAGAKTELIIFLTPHIVAEGPQLAKLTATERGNTELVPKSSFSEQEINRYIDTLPQKDMTPSGTPGKKKK
jgi:general secretion pathway protein D